MYKLYTHMCVYADVYWADVNYAYILVRIFLICTVGTFVGYNVFIRNLTGAADAQKFPLELSAKHNESYRSQLLHFSWFGSANFSILLLQIIFFIPFLQAWLFSDF